MLSRNSEVGSITLLDVLKVISPNAQLYETHTRNVRRSGIKCNGIELSLRPRNHKHDERVGIPMHDLGGA